jgi:hypothetical protein
MKIAYLYSGDLKNSGGVFKKVEYQINYLKSHGHEVLFLDWNHFNLKQNIEKPSFLSRYFLASKFFKLSRTFLKSQSINIVYMRTHTPTWSAYKICKEFNVFIEINSHEFNEYLKTSLPRFIVYILFDHFLKRKASGLICISHEIKDSLPWPHIPKAVIPNSCYSIKPDLNFFELQLKLPRPMVVFCGTGMAPWHGVDKIFYLAKKIPGVDFELYLTHQNVNYENLPNFKVFLNAPFLEIKKAYKRSTVGLGTLALHRKKMREASPLKIREYLAHGLPVIIGYKDTGLCNFSTNFVLNIANNEENVENEFHKIKRFIFEHHSKNTNKKDISTWYFDNLAPEKHEAERLSFMQKHITKD